MKKYLPPCVLMFANNEIATLIALIILGLILAFDVFKRFPEGKW